MTKYLKIYSVIILAALWISCEDWLDTTPETSVPDTGVITNEKSAIVALTGVYDALTGAEGTALVAWNSAADNVVGATSGQSIIVPILKVGSGAFDPSEGGGYVRYYQVINRANSVIYYVNGLDNFTGDNKNRILGEAYFIRALSYIALGKTYGGVPVVTKPSSSPDSQDGIKNISREETFKQAQSDLDEAESLLADVTLSNRGRASIWSVRALKARLYLFTEKWDKAEEYATKLIDNTSIQLTTTLSDFFAKQLSSEAIFELVSSSADRNGFYTYYLSSPRGGRLDYVPNADLSTLLNDPTIGGKRSDLLIPLDDADPSKGYAIREYDKQDGSSSIHVLRLAEQYLIRAEARLKKASPDKNGAAADINEIKGRAGITLLDIPTSLPVDDLLQTIEDERRYELAFEGHRYFDIIRTGRAPEVFGNDKPGYNPNYRDSRYWVFPFPQSVIFADSDLTQPEVYQ
ncbi:MAG: RagB/SusD family nutrient uptake outer membrane protein [Candidatus Symbiothrix sp.]|jgi:tetratricopeptide (TPR) repeat protein|nr:RagB/SusD family nutrient uptake outer membrane protein [Candidatus Symbiothrix sp.]